MTQIAKFRNSSAFHPGQLRIRQLKKDNPNVFAWVRRMGRQWGKTHLELEESCETCLPNFRDPTYRRGKTNTLLWYIFPTYKQCRQAFTIDVMPRLQRLKPAIKKINLTELEITFYNNAVWKFNNAESCENLRGAHVTHMICDEVAFFRRNVFSRVLEPMLLHYGEWVHLISTPNGKDHFYEMHLRGTAGEKTYNPRWMSVHGTIYETENEKYIAGVLEKQTYLPPDVFAQEYLAEFVEGGGKVFRNLDNIFVLDDYAKPSTAHFAGIDVGHSFDRTVITILNAQGECVFFKRFELAEQESAPALVESLLNIISSFYNCYTYIETNFNQAVFSYMRKKNSQVIGVKTDNKSKDEMVNRLNYSIANKAIKLPTHLEVLYDELLNYSFGYTKEKRLISYSAPAGLHDDCVISLCLANLLFCKRMRV